MSISTVQQLIRLTATLASQPTPHSRDEVFCLTVEALSQLLGDLRLLFYLARRPATLTPRSLTPCLARPLAANVFVYPPNGQRQRFEIESDWPYATPLATTVNHFGFLCVERIEQPLTEAEQGWVSLLATWATHQLVYLERLSAVQSSDQTRPIKIDEVNERLWVGETALPLKGKQLAVFKLLYERQGQLCNRGALCRVVYGGQKLSGVERQDSLDLLIFKLRKKLEQLDPNPFTIKTNHGRGYTLRLR